MARSRYRRIVLFFARIIVSIIFWDLFLPRIGLRSLASKTRAKRLRESAISFRALAIQMGGVLIKVGQFLSTRVDVLPREITSELSGLQDEVPPVDYAAIKEVAESEFGMALSKKFARFEETPLAAASLGQAHRAWIIMPVDPDVPSKGKLRRAVVVKIQRPNIQQLIEIDLAALQTVGRWLQKYHPIQRRANVPALLDEFTKILYEEIDYIAEGHNSEKFAENFKGDARLRIPQVIWSHTTKRVLTLENVWAIKITDYEAITAAGINRAEVASRLLDTYLKQIFIDGFFHADPHPGNLFVKPLGDPVPGEQYRPWQLTYIDFGMVGQVDPELSRGLRQLMIGVGTQNPKQVILAYQTMDMLLPDADLEMLERAEARIFERFWGKNMNELREISSEDIQEFTHEFRDLVYQMPFQVPQNIIFLARTVSILSGMCTGLDPEFNVWDHLAPFARKLMAEDSQKNIDAWLEETFRFGKVILSLPDKIDSVISRVESGQISVRTPDSADQTARLERAIRQVALGIIFAAMLLGGIQLLLAAQYFFGQILLGCAGFFLLWFLVSYRHPR
jgi:predicted unusual protein kinase regulating ubiquinone biosynthesis (AarF/ABC1/UbiB family)